MRITVDTNILARVLLDDDPRQTAVARAILEAADLIVIPVSVLCELVWIMRRGLSLTARDIAAALESVLAIDAVVTDSSAVDAGLAMLRAGGDFADGCVPAQGAVTGGDIFVSFDRAAVELWRSQGGRSAEPNCLLAQI